MGSVQLFLGFLLLPLITLSVLGQAILEIEDVMEARSKWEALQEDLGPLDYKYMVMDTTEGSDGMTAPTMVLVEADNVTEVEDVFFINEEDPIPSDFLTVNDMFDLMEEEIGANSTVASVFDRTYGYPLEYTITNDDDEVVSSVMIDPMTIYSLAQDELDSYQAIWSKTTSFDYDYTIRVSCFCVPSATTPKRIMVTNGTIANVTDIETGMVEDDLFFNTIEEVFVEIQSAIDGRWLIVDAQYNETMGFPLRFFFDVHPGLADEERATEISDVIILGDPLPDIDAEFAFTDTNNDADIESTPRPTLAPSVGATEGGTDSGMQRTTAPTSDARARTAFFPLGISVASILLGYMM